MVIRNMLFSSKFLTENIRNFKNNYLNNNSQ